MKTVKIGIMGAGVVGRGVIKSLRDQGLSLESRSGLRFEVVAVFDRSYKKKREFLAGIPASDDPSFVIDNPDVEIVLELIGGIDPAHDFIRKALQSKKSVVTANKALLAKYGKELFAMARENGVEIGFEAAVAGALPVIKSLRRSLIINEIHAFYGILNGTCNFIISRMQKDGMDYEAALILAQEKGFAEADPSFDVNGNDAAQKLALLAGLAFDTFVPEEQVFVEGITSLRKLDLDLVADMNRVIRLLGVARKMDDGQVQLRVHPAIIPEGHILAHVEEEKNAVFFDTSHSGPVLIMGQGAGSLPTAAAVISDLVFIGRNGHDTERWVAGDVKLQTTTENRYRFYLRFQTVDKTGVLSEISRILAENDISIATVHQQEGEQPIQLVVITHEADESSLMGALEKINDLDIVLAPTVYIRMLEDL